MGDKVKCYFGCGHIDKHDEGYINVDIRPAPHVDVQCDLSKTLPLEDEYADEIVAHSLLEHFPMGDYVHDDRPYANTVRILKEWLRVLKVGGTLELKVPNIEGLAENYTKNNIERIEFFRYLYGGQNYPENTHLAGFDRAILHLCLQLAGFSEFYFMHSHDDNGVFEPKKDWELRVRAKK